MATAAMVTGLLAERAAQEDGASAQAWRVGSFFADGQSTTSLVDMTVADASSGGLITLDASQQGVPRSEAWCRRAIDLLQEQDVADRVELEQLEGDLAQERELRAERQRHADEALRRYLDLRRRQYGPHGVARVVEALGRRFAVAEDAPVPLAPIVLGETAPRGSGEPAADAYYAWCDARDAVTAGVDGERMIRLADGSTKLRESALVERIGYLKNQVGARAGRVVDLERHIERLHAPPPAPVTLVFRDQDGREQRTTLPARMAAGLLGGRR
jgi:hypothetical protein